MEYARTQLGGFFKINDLFQAFRERAEHLSNNKLRQLAAQWEARGWLLPCADAVSSRALTPQLVQYAAMRLQGNAAA